MDLPEDLRGKLIKTPQPRWVSPMLATLAGKRFFEPGWICEPKLDGIRCLAFKRGGDINMYSRNRNLLNEGYPEIETALRGQAADALILDGEIAACEGDRTSFSLLQGRSHGGNPSTSHGAGIVIRYYVFDILYVEGYDVTQLPLAARKRLLEKAVSYTDPIRFLSHIPEADEAYFEEICGKGREGLIAKRVASLYVSGRSPDWLKFKCVREQEFVIGGYTEPRGTRTGFGALLLGYYEGKKLRYAGKVGTGFSESMLESLHASLSRMEQESSPFGDDLDQRGVHWVRPELVARVGFAEWTRDGRLRHPRFLGLRSDKEPGEVVRESA
ncbi:MAG: ATP-dependent DNA ligase [Actinobacteria bacterium]|jgi:DNA ligase D-like protein (predicted ligase)|nr:MAG: ATP-dependent DNA ligase [Actinomycetota bacterium]